MNQVQEPQVSIIVPVYNVEHYIDACLASIRAQTYTQLEILLVEDCSTDASLQALTPHLQDPRVHLIRHERNGGLSAARNTGIEAANGEYVMFVDSDDLIEPTLVARCVECAQRLEAEVVAYDCTPFIDGEAILPSPPASDATQARSITTEYFGLPHFAWLKFMRRNLLHDPALRFPVGLYYEDWPFHWRLGLGTRRKVRLDIPLYHYRQRPTSITGSSGRKLLDLFTIHSKVIEMLDAADDPGASRILAAKIRNSHWSVLTRIDPTLLGEALAQARIAEQALHARALPALGGWRSRTTQAIARLPASIGFPTLWALRGALGMMSTARKQSAQTQATGGAA